MKPRYRSLLVVAPLLAAILAGSIAEAGPKWRLRRWSSRPPIDPTIRESPSFNKRATVSSGRRHVVRRR